MEKAIAKSLMSKLDEKMKTEVEKTKEEGA